MYIANTRRGGHGSLVQRIQVGQVMIRIIEKRVPRRAANGPRRGGHHHGLMTVQSHKTHGPNTEPQTCRSSHRGPGSNEI